MNFRKTCLFDNKRTRSGCAVSKSNRKTKRVFKVNLQNKKICNTLNFFSLKISCNSLRILKKSGSSDKIIR